MGLAKFIIALAMPLKLRQGRILGNIKILYYWQATSRNYVIDLKIKILIVCPAVVVANVR